MFCNFDKIEENHYFFTGHPPKGIVTPTIRYCRSSNYG